MNTNPPELNAHNPVLEKRPDFNDFNNAVCSKRSAIVLILSLLASTVPLSGSAKTESSAHGYSSDNLVLLSLKEQISHINWNKLLVMSWPEIEKRLEKMSWPEIKDILNILSDVALDVRDVDKSEIGKKITKSNPLTDEDKITFFDMTDKYNIDEDEKIQSILNKESATSKDLDYLLVKFKEILRKQVHCVKMYVQIRSWLNIQMINSDLFESTEEYEQWAKVNALQIEKFDKLAKVLKAYEESLIRNNNIEMEVPNNLQLQKPSILSPINNKGEGSSNPLPKQNLRRGQNR